MTRTIQRYLDVLIDNIHRSTRLNVDDATYREYVSVAIITLHMSGDCISSIIGLYEHMRALHPQMTIKIDNGSMKIVMRVCAVNTSIVDMVNGVGNALPLSQLPFREVEGENLIMVTMPEPNADMFRSLRDKRATMIVGHYIYSPELK